MGESEGEGGYGCERVKVSEGYGCETVKVREGMDGRE